MMELISRQMMLIIAVVAIVVFLAMVVDLVSGIYKAYLRGEARRSEALKRTGYKFCLYHGTVLIAGGVDELIYLSRLIELFGWNLLVNIPLITIAVGIFWCVVEGCSVREKADEKTHSDIAKAKDAAATIIKILKEIKEGDKELIADTIIDALSKEKNTASEPHADKVS